MHILCDCRFCSRHRLKTGENVQLVPRDLLLMSEMVLPRFIITIIQYLRDGYTEPGEEMFTAHVFPIEAVFMGRIKFGSFHNVVGRRAILIQKEMFDWTEMYILFF